MPSKLTTLLSFLLLAGALPSGFASPAQVTEIRRGCSIPLSREKIIAAEKHFQEHKVVRRAVSDTQSQQAATLNVYWHVISKDATAAGGNIPDSEIADQITAMNNAYQYTGLTWRLVGTDRTVNADWFNAEDSSPQESAMKKALRKGGVADLNVYSTGIAGTARTPFPADYQSNPVEDGVVLGFQYLPGGLPSYNEGKVLVHEAGHWVGLYHTFEGGCNPPGDFVDDTPYQATASSGCPEGRDTCPAPGLDPIHNYMDYSNDACMTGFTPGQVTRLRQQLATYRGINV